MALRPGPARHPRQPRGWQAPAPGADDGGTAYGIALLSRLPLEVETALLPQSGRDEPRVALLAGLADGARRLTVAGTHLSFVPGPNVTQLRSPPAPPGRAGRPPPALGDLNLWWPAVRLLSLPGWRPLVRGGTFRNRPRGRWPPSSSSTTSSPPGPRPPCGPSAAGSSAAPPPTTGPWWSSWSGAEVGRDAAALVPLSPAQLATLPQVPAERPGPLVAQHVMATGHGSCLADRWPGTRGRWWWRPAPTTPWPATPAPSTRRPPRPGRGFVETPVEFEPLLAAATRELHVWPRVVLALEDPVDPPAPWAATRCGGSARGTPGRSPGWATRPTGSPTAGAAPAAWRPARPPGGVRRGAAGRRRLPVLPGRGYEDVGVATEPGFRGLGLSTACAGAVCQDVHRRARVPELDDLARQHRQPAGRGQARLPAPAAHDRLLVADVPSPSP